MLDTTIRQEADKEIDLNITNQLDLIDIYGILDNRSLILFKYVSNILHKDMLGDRTSLDTFKRIKIVQNAFSDHSKMNSEISNRRKFGKFKICGN